MNKEEPKRFSDVFNIPPEKLDELGVFNPILNYDTLVFANPLLLEKSSSPIIRNSYPVFIKYFVDVIRLLKTSKDEGDMPWQEAHKLLMFPEYGGICLGYGKKTKGNGTEKALIASVEANARGDQTEIEKLIKTCPRKRYLSSDNAYSSRMDYLFAMQMAVEADLAKHCLNYVLIMLSRIDTQEINLLEENTLQAISDLYTAWENFLSDKRIKIESMNEIVKDIRHPYVNMMLKSLTEPNQEQVKIYRDIFEETYNRNIC